MGKILLAETLEEKKAQQTISGSLTEILIVKAQLFPLLEWKKGGRADLFGYTGVAPWSSLVKH